MSEVKRILCIVSSMNAGGAETYLMKLYRTLNKNLYQMDFCINVKEKGFYDDEIRNLGGKIYFIPCKSERLRDFKHNLGRIVSENNYQYVLRITSNAFGFWDLKIAKKNGAKICIARSSNSSDGNSIKSKISHILGKVLYSRYVDIKISPSDLAAKYTFGKAAYEMGDVKILHNALDLNVYSYSDMGRNAIRSEFGINSNTVVVGHIGRFSVQKNHEYILEIFKQINMIVPNSIFMLVGKGEMQINVENRVKQLGISNNVIFSGIRNDIPNVLSAMDVFVFPSFYEGMPNTIIEAQATGLPCVISDRITQEADITGLVHYMDINDDPKKWASVALNCITNKRKDTKADFISNGYDINTVVCDFERIVFNEGV